ncbi:MAG TPA: hypothetical protein VIY69_03560 [Candidatus Acidoferrales bacterium]
MFHVKQPKAPQNPIVRCVPRGTQGETKPTVVLSMPKAKAIVPHNQAVEGGFDEGRSTWNGQSEAVL